MLKVLGLLGGDQILPKLMPSYHGLLVQDWHVEWPVVQLQDEDPSNCLARRSDRSHCTTCGYTRRIRRSLLWTLARATRQIGRRKSGLLRVGPNERGTLFVLRCNSVS